MVPVEVSCTNHAQNDPVEPVWVVVGVNVTTPPDAEVMVVAVDVSAARDVDPHLRILNVTVAVDGTACAAPAAFVNVADSTGRVSFARNT